jgi:hypothetical protein
MPGLGADEKDERGRERERARRIRDVRIAVGWVVAVDGDGDGEDECAGGSRNGQAVEGEDTETATGWDVPALDPMYAALGLRCKGMVFTVFQALGFVLSGFVASYFILYYAMYRFVLHNVSTPICIVSYNFPKRATREPQKETRSTGPLPLLLLLLLRLGAQATAALRARSPAQLREVA